MSTPATSTGPGPKQSTRLENFRFAPGSIHFELDGHPIEFQGEETTGPMAPLVAFYREASSDYQARRQPAAPPGLWSRVKHWISRVFGNHPRQAAGPKPAPPGYETEEAWLAAGPSPKAEAIPAPVVLKKPESSRRAAPTPAAAPLAPRTPIAASLRAVYADKGGVHVIWGRPEEGTSRGETELVYALDSSMADRLQQCYHQLAEIGHPVVDLRVWQAVPTAATPTKGSAPDALAAPAIPPGPPLRDPAPANKPEKKEAAFLMRLHPGPSDPPGRALVSPVEDEKNLQVLAAPERLVQALHAAADPQQPDNERLTFLRCGVGRGGLKVLSVGLGKDPDGGPGRWEELAPWWSRVQKEAIAQTGAEAGPKSRAPAGPDLRNAAPEREPELDL